MATRDPAATSQCHIGEDLGPLDVAEPHILERHVERSGGQIDRVLRLGDLDRGIECVDDAAQTRSGALGEVEDLHEGLDGGDQQVDEEQERQQHPGGDPHARAPAAGRRR